MFLGTFFDTFFPSTKLNDLNLDWLVLTMKKLGIPAGGETGQVLSKSSDEDFDVEWSNFSAPIPSDTAPIVNGSAAPGTSTRYSRADHVHPTDTSRASAATVIELSKPNLLDNWYFLYGQVINNDYSEIGTFPVNQRGQQSYSTAGSFIFDRWKLNSGSVTINQNGILLNGEIQQKLEHSVGLPVKATALLSDGTIMSASYDDNLRIFKLSATNKTIVAAKLEVGTVQTLARKSGSTYILNDVPNYCDALQRCLRFLHIIAGSTGVTDFGFAYAPASNHVNYIHPYPVEMRAKPTMTASASDLVITPGATSDALTTTSISLTNTTRQQGCIAVYASGITLYASYRTLLNANAKLILSAEI